MHGDFRYTTVQCERRPFVRADLQAGAAVRLRQQAVAPLGRISLAAPGKLNDADSDDLPGGGIAGTDDANWIAPSVRNGTKISQGYADPIRRRYSASRAP